MANELRSRSTLATDNSDKNYELAVQLKEIHDRIRELVLDPRLARQDGEERADLTVRLATIEFKLDNNQ